MTKLYILRPNEQWCYDRFYAEFVIASHDPRIDVVEDPRDADVVWLMASFCWDRLPYELLRSKRVVTTIDHIVPNKFSLEQFMRRDDVTDVYHVYNEHTRWQIKQYTDKEIVYLPYWAAPDVFHCEFSQGEARTKHKIPQGSYVVFSAQRDTEGNDLCSPKLEKGPDLLADAIVKWQRGEHPNVHVVLSSWRRQYIQTRLKDAGVPFTYLELPDQQTLCELYRCADVYPVTSRWEGGPQSLIEAGLLGVPVVSRPVGIAEQVLPQTAISEDVTVATPIVPHVPVTWLLPHGVERYEDFLCNV